MMMRSVVGADGANHRRRLACGYETVSLGHRAVVSALRDSLQIVHIEILSSIISERRGEMRDREFGTHTGLTMSKWNVVMSSLLIRLGIATGIIALSAICPVLGAEQDVSVGAQYDSTHVYLAPGDMDAFINSFTTTFGGKASPPIVTNVLPVPSRTKFRYIWTPVGTLSTFAFLTPIPFPFGSERTGYLVKNLTKAVAAARESGAEVVVEPFKDPIGMDAVVQWSGGFKTQLYWHFAPPTYSPLAMIPDNRVYLSSGSADRFVAEFLRFSNGKIIEDKRRADAAEIGRPGEYFRRIYLRSGFGNMMVFVTDGHLAYPFGREVTGYQVTNLDATIVKARSTGAVVLSEPHTISGRRSAFLKFPGGYISEIHAQVSK